MGFTIIFLKIFFLTLVMAAPLLFFFVVLICMLSLVIGRNENWSRFDALYYAFITATTVGYGDFSPVKKISRFLAIAIAFMGLMFTGIVVAITVNAASLAFKEAHGGEDPKEKIESTALKKEHFKY